MKINDSMEITQLIQNQTQMINKLQINPLVNTEMLGLNMMPNNLAQMNVPIFENTYSNIRQTIMPIYNYSPFTDMKVSGMVAALEALRSIMNKIQPISVNILDSFSAALENVIRIDFSPMFEALNIPYQDKYEGWFNRILFDSHWFPYAIKYVSQSCLFDIIDILAHTIDGSKNRTKKIDHCIFSYYSDKVIEKIKLEWRNYDMPEYVMRILHQAVQAYHRKEYALAEIPLVSLWECIMAEKVHNDGYRKTNQSKENFNELRKNNAFPAIYTTFFNECIMYPCHSADGVMNDVPGRHGVAHGWFTQYPTKKAALNAILFTDYLVRTEPICCEEDKNA